MARPKHVSPSLSAAFQEKAGREQRHLQVRLNRQLKSDMSLLYEEGLFSDLDLTCNEQTISVHKSILKARGAPLFDDFLSTERDGQVTLPDTYNPADIKDIVRQLYTVEMVPLCLPNLASELSFTDDMKTQALQEMNAGRGFGTPAKEQLSLDIACSSDPTLPPLADDVFSPVSPDDVEMRWANGRHDDVARTLIDAAHLSPSNTGISSLGHDLHSMYERGLHCDLVLVVGQKQFLVHRAILCARSSYFGMMLSGHWAEKDLQQIPIEGLSVSVFEAVLRYIYGACCDIPDHVSVLELAAAADMYDLTGLKDSVSLALRRDWCHFFHKPCLGCSTGVSEVLPIALTYGLRELLDRCLKWNVTHFVRLWPTQQFAQLPQELLDRCYENVEAEITTEKVIDIVISCDCLLGSLPRVNWARPVVTMGNQLMEACLDHLKNNFVSVISTQKFKQLGSTMALGLDLLERVFTQALMNMHATKACSTYIAFQQLACYCHKDCDWTEDFKQLIFTLKAKCDHYMQLYVHQLVRTPDWQLLTPQQQEIIKEGAYFVSVDDERRMMTPPKLTSASGTQRTPFRRKSSKRPATEQGDMSQQKKGPRQTKPLPPQKSVSQPSRVNARYSLESRVAWNASSSLPRDHKRMTLHQGKAKGTETLLSAKKGNSVGVSTKVKSTIEKATTNVRRNDTGARNIQQKNAKPSATSTPTKSGSEWRRTARVGSNSPKPTSIPSPISPRSRSSLTSPMSTVRQSLDDNGNELIAQPRYSTLALPGGQIAHASPRRLLLLRGEVEDHDHTPDETSHASDYSHLAVHGSVSTAAGICGYSDYMADDDDSGMGPYDTIPDNEVFEDKVGNDLTQQRRADIAAWIASGPPVDLRAEIQPAKMVEIIPVFKVVFCTPLE